MKLILAALLLPTGATAQPSAPAPQPQAAPPRQDAPEFDQMNRHSAGVACTPTLDQVAGPDRPPPAMRLDRQPPASMILAVDRTVAGCHEVTFASGRPAQAPLRR